MWTYFYDLHSGGFQKLAYQLIVIEASKPRAMRLFRRWFGRNPENVTCSCCGEDYSVDECENAEDALEHYFMKHGLEASEVCVIQKPFTFAHIEEQTR